MTTTPTPEAPTPETEMKLIRVDGRPTGLIPADFARTLERQRNEARAQRNEALDQLKVMAEEMEEATVAHAIADNALADTLRERDLLRQQNDTLAKALQEKNEQAGALMVERDEARKEREEIENTRDEQWLEAIAKCWTEYKGQPWDTRSGISSNIRVLFDEIEAARDTALAEVERLREALEQAQKDFKVIDRIGSQHRKGAAVEMQQCARTFADDCRRALQP